jgi:twitching motility protein PilT
VARLDAWLVKLKEEKGSDLHLAAGMQPRIRARGSLQAMPGSAVLDDGDLRAMLRELPPARSWHEYESTHDLDFAYGLDGVGRFRVNYFAQERGAGAVFRLIPEEIVPLEKLQLPKAVEGLAHLEQGLVLVTGPTGSGKSTTLAAIIDKVNQTYAKHVVTIEDPVEFVHRNKDSIFSHREVGMHTLGFAPALRSAVRQDADIILVGELRDRETIGLAITAAEMGMLVFGTLHTNNAVKTIDRIIDVFPSDEQAQVRLSLSESLAAILSQLLVPTADGKGRCAVVEILLRTPGLPNVIREGNNQMIHSIIQAGKAQGMQAMDDALFAYAKERRISPRDAYMKASEKARFEPLLED